MSNLRFKLFALFLLSVSHASGQPLTAELGDKSYLIPERYALVEHLDLPILDDATSDSLDENTGVTILLNVDELIDAVPGFTRSSVSLERNIESFLVRVTLVTPQEVESYRFRGRRDSERDLWEGREAYSGRSIEPFEGKEGWFRVYPFPELTRPNWHVVASLPTDEAYESPNFFVATCSLRTTDQKICFTTISSEDDSLVFQFRVEEHNLFLRDRIADYVETLLIDWEI